MTETARTYAIVLYELGIPEEMVREAVKLLKENPELPEVLNSPVVPLKSKHAVIEKVFREPEFSALMVRFLKKACDAGCIGQTEEIAKARDAYARMAAGVMDAELHYVTMPGAAQITGMKQFLCRKYNKKDVNIRFVNQPDLVGGFVLKAGDTEYDYSLKGQLVRLGRAVVR